VNDALYFEAHVTLEPVFDARLGELKALAHNYGFRVADLLLQRSREATPERSDKDAFLTARGDSFVSLMTNTGDLLGALKAAQFKIWRVKLESALLDFRPE
jgi:hypothetical protein